MVVTNLLRMMWQDRCTIYTYQDIQKANGATGKERITLVTEEPCKLSFSNNFRMNDPATVGLNAAEVFQHIKLFIRPELEIPPGSEILVITHVNGKTLHYRASGTPAVFTNHQEIILEVDQKWA